MKTNIKRHAKIKTTLQVPANHVSIPAGAEAVEDSVFDRHIRLKDAFDISTAAHYALECILLDQKRAHEQGKKHVVLIGEEHTVPAHRAFQASVLSLWSDCADHNEFMIGDECASLLLSDGDAPCEASSVMMVRLKAIDSLKMSHAPLSDSCVRHMIAKRALPYFA